MKNWIQYGVLAIALLCCAALQGQAQAVSPRTGEAPKTGPQTLTMDEFNRLPSEVQVIMKQHPDRFIIDQTPKSAPAPVDVQGKASALPVDAQLPSETPSDAKLPQHPTTPAPKRTQSLSDHAQHQRP